MLLLSGSELPLRTCRKMSCQGKWIQMLMCFLHCPMLHWTVKGTYLSVLNISSRSRKYDKCYKLYRNMFHHSPHIFLWESAMIVGELRSASQQVGLSKTSLHHTVHSYYCFWTLLHWGTWESYTPTSWVHEQHRNSTATQRSDLVEQLKWLYVSTNIF